MNRKEFLKTLRQELKIQRKYNIEEVLFYYDELIQDAVDNGEIERDFIIRLGNIKDIANQVENNASFIDKIKATNRDTVNNILNGSVKILSTIIYISLVFTIAVVGGAILISGGAIILQSLFQALLEPQNTNGYLILLGMSIMGIGFIILGIGMIKQFIKFSSNFRFTIIRKTKSLLDKKGENNNE